MVINTISSSKENVWSKTATSNKACVKLGSYVEVVESKVGVLALLVGNDPRLSKVPMAMAWDGIACAFETMQEYKIRVEQLQMTLVTLQKEIGESKEKKLNLEMMVMQSYNTIKAWEEEGTQLRQLWNHGCP